MFAGVSVALKPRRGWEVLWEGWPGTQAGVLAMMSPVPGASLLPLLQGSQPSSSAAPSEAPPKRVPETARLILTLILKKKLEVKLLPVPDAFRPRLSRFCYCVPLTQTPAERDRAVSLVQRAVLEKRRLYKFKLRRPRSTPTPPALGAGTGAVKVPSKQPCCI